VDIYIVGTVTIGNLALITIIHCKRLGYLSFRKEGVTPGMNISSSLGKSYLSTTSYAITRPLRVIGRFATTGCCATVVHACLYIGAYDNRYAYQRQHSDLVPLVRAHLMVLVVRTPVRCRDASVCDRHVLLYYTKHMCVVCLDASALQIRAVLRVSLHMLIAYISLHCSLMRSYAGYCACDSSSKN
jgi:hypothetical protein